MLAVVEEVAGATNASSANSCVHRLQQVKLFDGGGLNKQIHLSRERVSNTAPDLQFQCFPLEHFLADSH